MGKSLYEQMSPVGRAAVALVVGFHIPDHLKAKGVDVDNFDGCAGFRNALQDIPALPAGFTIGDAVRAYLTHKLAGLEESLTTKY